MSHKKLTLKDYGVEKVEKTLKNGLKVILIHKPFAPIYLEFAMRAGAVFDPVGKEGLAHFSEHLLVSGSEKYPKEKFSKIIESIGGYSNAYTSDDMMSVVCEVALPEHLESVKEYFEHSLVHNLINDDKVAREKGVITSEIERYHSSPDYVFHRFVNTELSKDTRYEHSILGSVKTISLFNQEDIHDYLKEVINTSNSILVVAGGVTIEEIEKVFDTMNINKEKSPDVLKKQILPPEAKPITLPFRKHMDQDIPQTNLLVGFLGPEYQSREYEVLSFVYSHIHDGFGSPFYKKLRLEKNLVYALHCFEYTCKDATYFGTKTGTPTEKTEETIAAIIECMKDLRKNFLSKEEIAYAINMRRFRSIRNKQESEDWVNPYLYPALFPEKKALYGDFPDWFNFAETFTEEEVRAVIEKYVDPDKVMIFTGGRK